MATAAKLEFPEIVHVPEHVMEAAIKKMEQDAHIIRALKTKNERLKEEKLEADLEASTEIAKHKFALANSVQRIAELEQKVDAMAQILAGDFQLLKDRVEGLAAREVV